MSYLQLLPREILDEVLKKKVDHESYELGNYRMLRINNSYLAFDSFYAYSCTEGKATYLKYGNVLAVLKARTGNLYIVTGSMIGIHFCFSTGECIQGKFNYLIYPDSIAIPIARYNEHEREVIIEWFEEIFTCKS